MSKLQYWHHARYRREIKAAGLIIQIYAGLFFWSAKHPPLHRHSHAGMPEQLLNDVRQRWNIENKNHHPRDSAFLEDKSRCHTGNTTANLALLRGVCLTLWRKTMPKAPAPAFITKVERNIDVFLDLVTNNQRLTPLK